MAGMPLQGLHRAPQYPGVAAPRHDPSDPLLRPLAADVSRPLSTFSATSQHGRPPAETASPAACRGLDGVPGSGDARLSPGCAATGGAGALLKEEPPSTPRKAAHGAALAADVAASPCSGVQPNGEAWPWPPGTILNIDQEKWKALLGEQAPAD